MPQAPLPFLTGCVCLFMLLSSHGLQNALFSELYEKPTVHYLRGFHFLPSLWVRFASRVLSKDMLIHLQVPCRQLSLCL